MATFTLKYRDTLALLAPVLKNPDKTVHDLTGAASVSLHIRLEDGTILTRTMTLPGDLTTGQPSYAWLVTDWDAGNLVVGTHAMEYEVRGTGPERFTFPNGSEDKLLIRDDIGNAA